MDNLFELVFWLIAIAIWLFSSQAKKKRTQPIPQETVQKRKPSSLEERILESLGLKIPEAPEPPPKIIVEKKKITPLRLPEEKPKAEALPSALVPEIKAGRGEFITLDKLEEGIILSVILGPPKAYTFQPGWRNWHSRRSQKPVGATS